MRLSNVAAGHASIVIYSPHNSRIPGISALDKTYGFITSYANPYRNVLHMLCDSVRSAPYISRWFMSGARDNRSPTKGLSSTWEIGDCVILGLWNHLWKLNLATTFGGVPCTTHVRTLHYTILHYTHQQNHSLFRFRFVWAFCFQRLGSALAIVWLLILGLPLPVGPGVAYAEPRPCRAEATYLPRLE
ncbi:hypothetical protein L209DRAFT_211981 [Thermothelomyces heterothallicus CBS 203.75]